MIAGTALLLLFIGIHNSWDTVTYLAVERGRGAKKRKGFKLPVQLQVSGAEREIELNSRPDEVHSKIILLKSCEPP